MARLNYTKLDKIFNELFENIIRDFANRKNTCPDCEDGKLEKTMTLTTAENKLEYWNCNNCPNQNVIYNDL